MTVIRYITRAFMRPALSWLDAIVFAVLTLISSQYNWASWLRLLVFAAFGFLVSEEHDWLRRRASRKETTP